MLTSGEARAVVGVIGGRSRATTLEFRSPARLFAPSVTPRSAWLIGSTLGGGLVTGDDAQTHVTVEQGARALYTTLGSTKAYRGNARQSLRADVDEGALLVVAPDPLVPFRGATVEQELRMRVAAGGSLALFDALSSGRVRHGERWAFSRVWSRLVLDVAGQRVIDETTLLDARDGPLDARAGRFDGLATLLLVGPLVERAAAALEAELAGAPPRRNDQVVEAASRLHGGALLVRSVAGDERALLARARTRLAFVAELLGDDPFARRGL